MEDTPKQCSKCKEWKTEKDFNKNMGKRDGLQSWCRACYQAHSRQWRWENSELKRENNTIWNKREVQRKAKYGVSVERQRELFDKQGRKCLICRVELDFNKAHMDHDHISKEVRGFLCHGCNTGIGHLGDDPKRIRRAAAYLQAYQTDHPDPHQLLLNLRSIGGF